MGDPDGGVGGVDALPARAGRAEDVDAQVVRVDGDVDLLGLGQHEDAGRGGVDAALGLGDRHPLHAVHAALELQPGPDALVAARLDRDGDVLVAAEVGVDGVEDLGRPAAPLGVAQVHPQQVAGEQRRLLAALPRLDLEDDVLVVVGVAGQQQLAQPAGQLLDPLPPAPVASAANEASSPASSRAVAEVAAGLVERPGGLHDRCELARTAGPAAGRGPGRRAPPGRRARCSSSACSSSSADSRSGAASVLLIDGPLGRGRVRT